MPRNGSEEQKLMEVLAGYLLGLISTALNQGLIKLWDTADVWWV